jgi:hypothetical protein
MLEELQEDVLPEAKECGSRGSVSTAENITEVKLQS